MRVMVIGASGALGTRLVTQLAGRGHEVIGTFRSPTKAGRVRALGAQPVALDLLDPGAVTRAVREARPDAIIHQATALADARFSRSLDQSFAPYRYLRAGSLIKNEDDPLDPSPPASARETFAAMTHVDEAVVAAGGIALRYGGFYGIPDSMTKAVRKRQSPVIGAGTGIMPFIHLDDAAAATALALDHQGPAIYNITDDEPAPMSEWLPALAGALGARRPFRAPAWAARLMVGEEMARMSLECRGASNARAKRELGWTLRYPSWRQGFAASYGSSAERDMAEKG